MQSRLKVFNVILVFLVGSYATHIHAAALPKATGNSFCPGGSCNAAVDQFSSANTILSFSRFHQDLHAQLQEERAAEFLDKYGPFFLLHPEVNFELYKMVSDEANYNVETGYAYKRYLRGKYQQYRARQEAAGVDSSRYVSEQEFIKMLNPGGLDERDPWRPYNQYDGGTMDTLDPADYEGYAQNSQLRRSMYRLSDLFEVNEYSSADHHGEGTVKPAKAYSPWDNMFLFGSGGYRNQDVDSVGAAPGSETDSIQVNIGIAAILTSELTSGISLTIADSDGEADTTTFNTGTFVPFESDARSATFSLFTTFRDLEGYNFSGGYSYTHTSTDLVRRTAFNDVGGGGNLFVQANADDVDSGTHSFSLSGSYTRFEGNGWMWGPNASLSFGFGETDSYTETGGGTNVNLSVGESEYSFWTFTAGVHGSKYFKLSDNAKYKTLFNFGANWVHTESETDNDVLITQVDTGATSTRLAGTEAANKPGDDFLQLSLGISHNVDDRTRLSLSHSMELLRDNSFAYFIGINFSHVWD